MARPATTGPDVTQYWWMTNDQLKETATAIEKANRAKKSEQASNFRDFTEQQNERTYADDKGDDAQYTKGSQEKKIYDDAIAHTLSPYTFRFSGRCMTWADAVKEQQYIPESEEARYPIQMREGKIDPTQYASMMFGDGDTPESALYTRFSIEDTSIGGNDAINCRWAFGRDDDIIHPLNAIMGEPAWGGLGRVYLENYQMHQQLLHITLGVPEYATLWQFYQNAVNGEMADEVNAGGGGRISKLIGTVIGGVFGFLIKLPAAPIRMTAWLADALDPTEKITKYYELRGAMAQYYRYVNSIYGQLSVLLGMVKNPWYLSDNWNPKQGQGGTTGGTNNNATLRELYDSSIRDLGMSAEEYERSMPMFMQKAGPDVWRILSKKDARHWLLSHNQGTVDDYMESQDPRNQKNIFGGGGFFDVFWNRLKNTVQGADKFIAFRINKSTDTSETITNQTGQSALANALNSAASAARDAKFSAGGDSSKIVHLAKSIPGIGAAVNMVEGIISGTMNSFGLTSLGKAIMTGSGFIDIPEVWTGSSFAKNYSFSFTFRPGCGDNVAIHQDCYLPLCMCLAMACPRSLGNNSFGSPYLLRAYCKGMFAVPLGIIESMTITRGASEFGWNMARLPTVISVNMSIKDLSPVMHLAMVDSSAGLSIFGGNNTMQEYLHTLSGSGLNERILFSEMLAKRLTLMGHLFRTTWRNPNYFATMIGDMSVPRIFGAIVANSGFSHN